MPVAICLLWLLVATNADASSTEHISSGISGLASVEANVETVVDPIASASVHESVEAVQKKVPEVEGVDRADSLHKDVSASPTQSKDEPPVVEGQQSPTTKAVQPKRMGEPELAWFIQQRGKAHDHFDSISKKLQDYSKLYTEQLTKAESNRWNATGDELFVLDKYRYEMDGYKERLSQVEKYLLDYQDYINQLEDYGVAVQNHLIQHNDLRDTAITNVARANDMTTQIRQKYDEQRKEFNDMIRMGYNSELQQRESTLKMLMNPKR